MKKAIFPGSFNPIHEGHIHIIEKALKIFDFLYVVLSVNPEKEETKNLDKRFETMKDKLSIYKNLEVVINKNEMTAVFAKRLDIKYIVRSGRNDIDFKYELELAAGNNSINNELETILIIPDYSKIEFSSRLERQKIK